jgi:hypothetical protein
VAVELVEVLTLEVVVDVVEVVELDEAGPETDRK